MQATPACLNFHRENTNVLSRWYILFIVSVRSCSHDENFANLMLVCQNQTFLAVFPTFVAPDSDFFRCPVAFVGAVYNMAYTTIELSEAVSRGIGYKSTTVRDPVEASRLQ